MRCPTSNKTPPDHTQTSRDSNKENKAYHASNPSFTPLKPQLPPHNRAPVNKGSKTGRERRAPQNRHFWPFSYHFHRPRHLFISTLESRDTSITSHNIEHAFCGEQTKKPNQHPFDESRQPYWVWSRLRWEFYHKERTKQDETGRNRTTTPKKRCLTFHNIQHDMLTLCPLGIVTRTARRRQSALSRALLLSSILPLWWISSRMSSYRDAGSSSDFWFLYLGSHSLPSTFGEPICHLEDLVTYVQISTCQKYTKKKKRLEWERHFPIKTVTFIALGGKRLWGPIRSSF